MAGPYSTWDEVKSIGRGEFVQVHYAGGSRIHGIVFRSSSDSLSVLRGNKEVVVPASEITKVYRVKGDTRSLAKKILDGSSRGAEISEDLLPIGDPRGNAHPIGVGIGAAIGATVYILSNSRTERVLVFSR